MSLWDPEAAGNAAVYLRLDDMKMLEIRNAPFDGMSFEVNLLLLITIYRWQVRLGSKCRDWLHEGRGPWRG